MMHLFKIAPRHSKILRAAAISPLLAVMALRAQEQSDDTYADLEKPGPVITIRGNQSYDTYALMQWEDGTKIDARDAHWSSFGWGREIHDPKVNDTTRNGYPIQIGADWIARHPTVPRVKGDPGYDPAVHGAAEPPPQELARIAMDAASR